MTLNVSFRVLLISFFVKAALLLPTSVWAGLHFNNRTNSTVFLAIGYYKNNEWLSKGWFKIPPGSSTTPIGENLNHKFYYYYAYSKTRIWSGNHNFCIHETEAFSDLGKGTCSGLGYTIKSFKEQNTEDATDFSINLNPAVELELLGDNTFCVGDHNNKFSKYYHKQEKYNWCWATCIQMVLHKQTGHSYDQCTIVKIGLQTDDCLDIGADGYVISRTAQDWPVEGGKTVSKLSLNPTFDDSDAC